MPSAVWEMDMRETNDLMESWLDSPPAHVAARQLRDYVMGKFGDRPPSRSAPAVAQTPDQLAAVLGLGGADGNG